MSDFKQCFDISHCGPSQTQSSNDTQAGSIPADGGVQIWGSLNISL